MKNKSLKHQKKGSVPTHAYPNRKPPKLERKPHRTYPCRDQEQQSPPENSKSSQGYPPWLSQGSRDAVYMDEITVYYSVN